MPRARLAAGQAGPGHPGRERRLLGADPVQPLHRPAADAGDRGPGRGPRPRDLPRGARRGGGPGGARRPPRAVLRGPAARAREPARPRRQLRPAPHPPDLPPPAGRARDHRLRHRRAQPARRRHLAQRRQLHRDGAHGRRPGRQAGPRDRGRHELVEHDRGLRGALRAVPAVDRPGVGQQGTVPPVGSSPLGRCGLCAVRAVRAPLQRGRGGRSPSRAARGDRRPSRP